MSKLWHDARAQYFAQATPESWREYAAAVGIDSNAPLKAIVGVKVPPRPNGKQPIPAAIRWEVWERDDFTCQECGSRRFLQIDHIYPESRGGPLLIENLQTLCKTCNVRKGRRVRQAR